MRQGIKLLMAEKAMSGLIHDTNLPWLCFKEIVVPFTLNSTDFCPLIYPLSFYLLGN